MKRLILATIIGLCCALANAKGPQPTLDQLATACQQVANLNEEVKAKQDSLKNLGEELQVLKDEWYGICKDVLSKPECTVKEIESLISLTNPELENDLIAILQGVKALTNNQPNGPYVLTSSNNKDKKPGKPKGNDKEKNNDGKPAVDVTGGVAPINHNGSAGDGNNNNQQPELPVVNPVNNEDPKTNEDPVRKKDDEQSQQKVYNIIKQN